MPVDSSDHRLYLETGELIRETRTLAETRRKLVFEYCASNLELIIKTRHLVTETLAILRDPKSRR